MIKKLGEGTFSEVFKAQAIKTGEFVEFYNIYIYNIVMNQQIV